MSKTMDDNIRDFKNTQYFSDSTYYAVPSFNKGAKLWLLLEFKKT